MKVSKPFIVQTHVTAVVTVNLLLAPTMLPTTLSLQVKLIIVCVSRCLVLALVGSPSAVYGHTSVTQQPPCDLFGYVHLNIQPKT